jgi:type II secretory pathway predicted ATPase ExeA
MQQQFLNPFRPGAGQKPPYLAGRHAEQNEFLKALNQKPVIQNIIITGLRGVGKTVLLETLKPLAIRNGWLWAGTDLSESAGLSERSLSTRIITDISSITSTLPAVQVNQIKIGFSPTDEVVPIKGTYHYLTEIYNNTPGLDNDKLKAVLETVWNVVKNSAKGIVLAYDEAQILKDHRDDKQYPLSLLLEVIQYLQRREIPYMLVLTGLPTLLPNLVETRTYAERMFHVLNVGKLDNEEAGDAIRKPIEEEKSPVKFNPKAITEIINYSGGYPYFIQFLCKETYDSYISQKLLGIQSPVIFLNDIVRKLDTDFYAGRWARISDRQRDILKLISMLQSAEEEFSLQDISNESKTYLDKQMSTSNINQILNKLVDCGLIYKNRHGKYSFAVPMMSGYIRRHHPIVGVDEDPF